MKENGKSWGLLVLFVLLFSCVAQNAGAATNRLTVALLSFADKTGEPELAYWRHSVPGFIGGALAESRALRIYPHSACEYGLRKMDQKVGDSLSDDNARKIGELIEARRVVWGEYHREDKRWVVTAQVMNVASGKASEKLTVSAEDWEDASYSLAVKILEELKIKPSKAELARMKKKSTQSAEAMEHHARSYAAYAERKPYSESEQLARLAVKADPQWTSAHLLLATGLLNMGKIDEGSDELQTALKLKPGSASAHMTRGIVMALHRKDPEALAKEAREAIRLDPDEPDYQVRLAEYFINQGKWQEALARLAVARRLNPVSSDVFSHMGFVYAAAGKRVEAMSALKEAEFFMLDDDSAQHVAQAYDNLHEVPQAIEWYKRLFVASQARGMNPQFLEGFRERQIKLEATLIPELVRTDEPKIYSDTSLRAALHARLSEKEFAQVKFPLASNPQMKQWAADLTKTATSDLQKAHALYDGLAVHLDPGSGGSRTAQETFAQWKKPGVSFRCQEYARLYVALARDVGLKAYWVFVKRDFENQIVLHACAGVFVDGKVLLADPMFHWFGVPHKEFEVQDDYQAVVYQLNQLASETRLRMAVKLQPDDPVSQFNLALHLMDTDRLSEGRLVLDTALKLDPSSWYAHCGKGILALHEKHFDDAVKELQIAADLYPGDGSVRYALALALFKQGKLREARDEFRASLRNNPPGSLVSRARHAVADLTEKLGVE
jgi:tetratricopeptide (TPR) repeat protein